MGFVCGWGNLICKCVCGLLVVSEDVLCVLFWLKIGYKDPDMVDANFFWCALPFLSLEDWFGGL